MAKAGAKPLAELPGSVAIPLALGKEAAPEIHRFHL